MFEAFLQFLQNPTVQEIAQACIATAAVSAGAASIKPLLKAKKETHEWQLLNCLESALFQTEKKYHWHHQTDAIYDTFFTSLFTFSGTFSVASLKQIFQNSLHRTVTDEELNTWIENFLKQLSLKKHTNLREFIKIHHLLEDKPTPKKDTPSPILTPGAKIWDDQNILARDEFIDGLCADFSQHPRRIQLVGMGGIGKTEILNKLYARIAKNPGSCEFDFVGLVHFNGSIESDIAQQIEYPAQYHGFQGEKAALSYLHDLCIDHHVLLLIDDIRAQQPLPKRDDKTLEFLMTLNASVLLASRVPFPQFDKRKVDVLPSEECIKIFERQYGRDVTDEEDRSLLTKIIEEKAGRNTLIVNRLGGMAKDPGWSIKELFDHLEVQQFSIPKSSADDETLQLEIKKLYILDKDFTPAEISILEAFSIFPALPLALGLCKEWLSEDAGVEPDECARILAGLAQKTWLVRHEAAEDASKTMYSMHQVVREAIKGQVEIDGSTHNGLIDACAEALNQNTNNYIFAVAAQIIPFAIVIFEGVREVNVTIAALSDAIGNYFKETASFSLALQWHQTSVFLAEIVFGIDHPNTATAYCYIAGVYNDLGDYQKALEWFFKDLEISERTLGEVHPSTAATYNNIAFVYQEQGEYPKALEWYFKALVIAEKELGKEHHNTAIAYNNIAVVFNKQGDYPKALEWFFKGLAINEKVLGKEHPDTAITYNNIAGVYKNLGDYPKALEWYFKALLIREKVLGKEHPDTAIIYNNIATVYSDLGDNPKALEWFYKALDIQEKVLGKEHPETASTYNNIAAVYDNLGYYSKALEWYSKALTIRQCVLGEEHPDTATTYNNIAGIYTIQGDYPKALEWYFRALIIHEKILGKEHPNTATTYNNIAGVYQSLGDFSKSLEWYFKALLIREKVFGKEHNNTAAIYSNIAMVYFMQADFQTALKWLQKALPIFEAKLGSNHPSTENVRDGIELVTAKLAESNPT